MTEHSSIAAAVSSLQADGPSGSGSANSRFAGDVRRAILWRSGSQIAAQIISWSSTLIVMRLLAPADYGLFAMSLVMLSFLTFLNGYGFASALIQERDLTRQRIRQAFGLLLAANAVIATLQWFAAPLVAAYYGQPIVIDMLRVQTLIYLSTPFIAIPEVLMGRSLDFRSQALVNMASAMTGAVLSLILAWAGYGVWTLVYAPIVMFWVRAIGLNLMVRALIWPSFDFRGCGSIFRFGLAILFTQMFWLVQTQSDIFVIGRRFTPHEVGVYSQAVFLATIFYARFVPPLNEVAFPAYARLQDDLPALRAAFLKSARLIMMIAAPVYAGMAVTASPLVATLFGSTWQELPPLVEWMAWAMPFMTMQILFAPALNAVGKPEIPVRGCVPWQRPVRTAGRGRSLVCGRPPAAAGDHHALPVCDRDWRCRHGKGAASPGRLQPCHGADRVERRSLDSGRGGKGRAGWLRRRCIWACWLPLAWPAMPPSCIWPIVMRWARSCNSCGARTWPQPLPDPKPRRQTGQQAGCQADRAAPLIRFRA